MATTDTNISQLVINELTKAQYEALTPSANQLYFISDYTLEASDISDLSEYTASEVETLWGTTT